MAQVQFKQKAFGKQNILMWLADQQIPSGQWFPIQLSLMTSLEGIVSSDSDKLLTKSDAMLVKKCFNDRHVFNKSFNPGRMRNARKQDLAPL